MPLGSAQGRSPSTGAGGRRRTPLQLGLLMMMMMMMMMAAVGGANADTEESQESQEILEEDETVSEEVLEPVTSDLSRVSPFSSWLIFRRNSNKGDNRRSKASRRSSKHGLPGPPGPPGPQGPPGPPASLIPQQQDLIQNLQRKLKDISVGGVCRLCDAPPRVSSSFLGRLLQSVSIPRRSLLELQPYGQPLDSELSLQRGQSFNSSTGRFTAPLSGFYQVTASLLIESADRVQVRVRDSVRASVCIESLCQRNLSLESVMGVAIAGGTFSLLLTGTLYLQVGEYVSVFVDNATGSALSVLQDSVFSGVLLGV